MIEFVLGAILVIYILYLSSSKPNGYPPGPPRAPLIGYLPWINQQYPYITWNQLRKKYGDVLGIYFATQPVVVVNGWEALKEGLHNDDLNDRPDNMIIKEANDQKLRGVMFVNQDFWKVQRRFTLFHLRNLGFGKRSHETVMHEQMQDTIQDFKEKNGEPFSVQGILGKSAVNILWSVVGGERFSRNDEKLNTLVDLIIDFFRAGQNTGILNLAPYLRHICPNLIGYTKIMEALHSCLSFIKKSISDHKNSFDPDSPRDFIDIFLKELQNKTKDESFTEDQLAVLCLDLFTAGTDTGSSLATFSIMFLCLFPEKQRKVHEEIIQITGKDRLPSIDDKAKLIYTEAFLQEVLRMRCPAPHTVPHWSRTDTKLQGHRIPKDTLIMFNLMSAMMDEDYWGDPEEFRPERFIENGKLKTYERMIPFGIGRRACLGESLARMTSYMTFAALVQNFTFSFPPGEGVKDTRGEFGFTLGPPAFKVIATPTIIH